METRTCKKCGVTKPLTAEFFGHMPNRSHRHVCRKCMSVHARQHQINNPLQDLERRQDRSDRMDDYGSKVDRVTAQLVVELAKGRCFYCNEYTTRGHVDHRTPVVQGGSNEQSNLVYACVRCNQSKHAKNGVEFYLYRQELGYPISQQFRQWWDDLPE
jgi:hypothetical protein